MRLVPGQSPPPAAQDAHILVVGLGTAGLGVVALLVHAGVRVQCVDSCPDSTAARLAADLGFSLSIGDARDETVLRQAGIAEATALLVLINDDALTLRVGLAARGICPHLRIILRIFNSTTLDHLPPAARLEGRSLSALAAPTFVAATLLPSLCGAFTLGATHYGVVPAGAGPRDERAEAAGLTRLPARQGAVIVGPLSVLVDRSEAAASPALRGWPRRASQGAQLWYRVVAVAWQRSNRVLRGLLIVLALAMLVAVAVFALAGHIPPLEALYFVVSTLTTVGYGDISVLHQAPPLVIFDIFLMLGGALMMTIVYAFIIDLILGTKMDRGLDLRAATRRNHVVVVGVGSVGYRCALALKQRGIATVLVDQAEHSKFGDAARAAGLTVLVADAQSENALRRAGIDDARALLCATSSDQTNVEVGLLARGLRPDLHVVLRVFDPVFAAQVRDHLGMPATFSAAVLAAPGFVAAALGAASAVVPPPLLPGAPDIELSLRSPLPDTAPGTVTTVADLCDGGMYPLALLQGDGHCTPAPPDLPLAPPARVLVATITASGSP